MDFETTEPCRRCDGNGNWHGVRGLKCYTCNGTGRMPKSGKRHSQYGGKDYIPCGALLVDRKKCTRAVNHKGPCKHRGMVLAVLGDAPRQCNGGEPHAQCTKNRGHSGACAPKFGQDKKRGPIQMHDAKVVVNGTPVIIDDSAADWSTKQQAELTALGALFED